MGNKSLQPDSSVTEDDEPSFFSFNSLRTITIQYGRNYERYPRAKLCVNGPRF